MARRVKCDEQRPSCWRCTSAGRECKGYGIWTDSQHLDRPAANSLNVLYSLRNTGPVGRLSTEDRQVFEWCMLANLHGVFPFPFLESLLPQACYNESAVLYCVLALGSVHKKAFMIQLATASPCDIENLQSATLRHYNTAISLVNGSQHVRSRTSTRVALMVCLTFVLIEYLQKRPMQGLLHLQHGLRILRSYEEDDGTHQSTRDPVDDWLADAFHRFDVQTKLLLNTSTQHQPCLEAQATKNNPTAFISLHEARQQLDHLVSETFQLQRKGRVAQTSADIGHSFEALATQQRLHGDLRSWLEAYRAWQAKPSPSSLPPPRPYQQEVARHLLSIYHMMAYIITATALDSGDESVFDRYTSQFASILASSKDVIQVPRPVTSGRLSPCGAYTLHFGFTSDLGLIPVLYYTALKCRDPRMRRDALAMLATETRQEGIWDGTTAALIAAEVIRIEEALCPPEQSDAHDEWVDVANGSDDSVSSGSPSSQSQPWRISDVEVKLPRDSEATLEIICRRKLLDGTSITVERKHNGTYWY